MLRKMLPVNLDLVFRGWCWDTIRLCIILTDNNNIPWYINHFIPVYMNENFFVRSDNSYSNLSSTYSEVLDVLPITDYSINNIIKLITDSINNNKYIFFGWDRYYVKGCSDNNKQHYNHGALIHGYDMERNEFDIVEFGMNGKYYSTHKIDTKTFTEAFFHGAEKTRKDNSPWHFIIDKPLSAVTLKNNSPRIEPVRIWSDIVNEIKGYEYEDIDLKNKGARLYKIRGGLKIYNGYQELMDILSENNDYLRTNIFALYSIKFVMENKALYKLRLSYLFDNNIIPRKDSLFECVENICSKFSVVWELLIKYMQLKHKEDYIIQCKNEFMEIEKLERSLLIEISNLLSQGMRNYYFGKQVL